MKEKNQEWIKKGGKEKKKIGGEEKHLMSKVNK